MNSHFVLLSTCCTHTQAQATKFIRALQIHSRLKHKRRCYDEHEKEEWKKVGYRCSRDESLIVRSRSSVDSDVFFTSFSQHKWNATSDAHTNTYALAFSFSLLYSQRTTIILFEIILRNYWRRKNRSSQVWKWRFSSKFNESNRSYPYSSLFFEF